MSIMNRIVLAPAVPYAARWWDAGLLLEGLGRQSGLTARTNRTFRYRHRPASFPRQGCPRLLPGAIGGGGRGYAAENSPNLVRLDAVGVHQGPDDRVG